MAGRALLAVAFLSLVSPSVSDSPNLGSQRGAGLAGGADSPPAPVGGYAEFLQKGSHGTEAGGNIQQDFMRRYAGDYQEYMSTGDQGKGGNIPPFSAAFLEQHAGSFGTDANKPSTAAKGQAGAGSASGQPLAAAGGQRRPAEAAAPAGGYQQYTQRYASDYSKYMQGQQPPEADSQRQPTKAAAPASGYQRYQQIYAGDYQKYMKGQQSWEAGSSNSQDYQHYVQQYAGSSGAGHWRPEHSNMTQDEAVRQYGAKWVPHVRNASDAGQWAKAFKERYTNTWSPRHENLTQEEAMRQYAGHWVPRQYAGRHAEPEGPARAPPSASECRTRKELEAWRQGQLAQIRSFVPKAYQGGAQTRVQQEFRSNEARIVAQASGRPAADAGHTASGPAPAAGRKAPTEAAKSKPEAEPKAAAGEGAAGAPAGHGRAQQADPAKATAPEAEPKAAAGEEAAGAPAGKAGVREAEPAKAATPEAEPKAATVKEAAAAPEAEPKATSGEDVGAAAGKQSGAAADQQDSAKVAAAEASSRAAPEALAASVAEVRSGHPVLSASVALGLVAALAFAAQLALRMRPRADNSLSHPLFADNGGDEMVV